MMGRFPASSRPKAEVESSRPQVFVLGATTITIPPRGSALQRRRRASIVDCLESYEEVTRCRRWELEEKGKWGESEAIWDAAWHLRLDVVAALERCETAERAARWASDE